MIVLFEKNANGKIEFTKEELEELLEKARQEGIKEGQKTNYIYTTPSNPSPTIPNSPYISPITCSSSSGESDIMATSQTQGVPPTIK